MEEQIRKLQFQVERLWELLESSYKENEQLRRDIEKLQRVKKEE